MFFLPPIIVAIGELYNNSRASYVLIGRQKPSSEGLKGGSKTERALMGRRSSVSHITGIVCLILSYIMGLLEC